MKRHVVVVAALAAALVVAVAPEASGKGGTPVMPAGFRTVSSTS
jgi:hypothetical protein